MKETTKGHGGRPVGDKPRTGAGGKGRVLSANISQQARDLLEREAKETGFSISQVADRWIVAAGKGEETFAKKYQLPANVVGAIDQISAIASAVAAVSKDPTWAHFLIIQAMQEAIPRVMGSAPASGRLATQLKQNEKVILALEAVAKAIAASGDGPLKKAAARKPDGGAHTIEQLFADHPHELLAAGKFREIKEALEALSECPSKAANVEIANALKLVEQAHADDVKEAAEYLRLDKRAREIVQATFARLEGPPTANFPL